MSKLRKKSVKALHRLLADAALHWQDPALSEPLRRYALGHGTYHLSVLDDHDGLWHLLRDDSYRQTQVETSEQYESAFRALRHGLDAYAARDGTDPQQDERLCWLALRAGELAEEAKRGVVAAFEWMRERPLEDERRVEDALERLSFLDEEGFFKAALLLLWIEADRLQVLPESERTDRWARRVLQAVEERIPAGNKVIDWSQSLPVDFMAWLVGRILAVCHHLDMAPIAARTSKAKAYVTALMKPRPGAERIDAMLVKHALQMTNQITEGHDRAETLAAAASALIATGDLHQAAGVVSQALLVADAIIDKRWKAKTLATLVATIAHYGDTKQAISICERALTAADTITSDRWKAEALAAVATAFAKAGEFAQALRVAETIQEDYRKARGIGAIAASAAAIAKPQHAEWVCEQILLIADAFASERWKAETFVAVANAFAISGDTARTHQLCEQALSLARSFVNDYWMSETIIAVSAVLAQGGYTPRVGQILEQARQLAHKITDSLLQASTLAAIASVLVKTERLDRALSVAHAITEAPWKAKTLGGLAASGDPKQAAGVCEQALQVAHTISSDRVQAQTLATVVSAFAQTGQVERAIQVAEVITQNKWKVGALTDVASVVANEGDVLRARNIFEQSLLAKHEPADSPGIDNTETLVVIAETFSQYGRSDLALQVAQSINYTDRKSKNRKAKVLATVASALARVGDAKQAHAVFAQAIRVAESLEEPYWLASTLAAISEDFGETGDTGQTPQALVRAIEVAGTITDHQSKASCLEDIARALTKLGKFEPALLIANGIEEDHRKAETLTLVTIAIARAGQVLHALDVAGTITDHRFKAKSLAATASTIAKAGDKVQALSLCKQALQLAATANYSADARSVIVLAYIQAGEFERALEVAETLTNDWEISGTLAGITFALSNPSKSLRARQLIEQVIQIAGSISNTQLRASTLVSVSTALTGFADPARANQLIEQAIQLVDEIPTDQQKIKCLTSIGGALVKMGNPYRFELLLEQLSASQQVWGDVLPLWRIAVRTETPSPGDLLRRSMCHYPFLNPAAFNGIISLLLMHIQDNNDEAWMRIIRHCPKLGLDFLLENHPTGEY